MHFNVDPTFGLRVVVLFSFFSALAYGRNFTPQECPVIGNSNTRIYHVPKDRNYRQMLVENKTTKDNRVCFNTSSAAESAGE